MYRACGVGLPFSAAHFKMKQSADAKNDDHQLPLRSELQRKALHLLALVVPVGMLLLGREASLAILVPLAVLAIAADITRSQSASFQSWIDSIFGFMMRPDEKRSSRGLPILNGATWVLISATLLTLLFPVELAGAAFASFMVADAAAAVVGRTVGRHPWGGGPRTMEGSLAFIAAGILVMVPVAPVSPWVATASVVAGAATEIPKWPINDNLSVPLVMSLILYLI